MAHVHMTPGSSNNNKWVIVRGAILAVSPAVVWWSQGYQGGQTEATPSATASTPMAAQVAETPPSPVTAQAVEELKSLQAAAAKEIERDPAMKPIVGPVTERPPFVSHMEWMMLKGAAEQHASPERELTRMVNFLRFTKQLELWQALPKGAQEQAKRQTLALQLLDDLPARLANGEMPLKDLRTLQAQLLEDAVPDAQERAKRAALEAQRLDKVAAQAASAAG